MEGSGGGVAGLMRARFATSNTFRKQFYDYLLPNGYVERVSRGIYKITPKGEKLLEILN